MVEIPKFVLQPFQYKFDKTVQLDKEMACPHHQALSVVEYIACNTLINYWHGHLLQRKRLATKACTDLQQSIQST